MNEVYHVEGGRKPEGEIWRSYNGLSKEGAVDALAMEEEHFINAAFRKPGQTIKGIVAIITEEEARILNSRNK